MKLIKRYQHLFKIRYLRLFIRLWLLAACLSVIAIAIYTYENPISDKLAREGQNTKNNIVNEVTELHPVKVAAIVTPHTIEEIVDAVKKHDHVSIGGGRNSMGGQTASERAVHLDMREFNKVLSFSPKDKEITVQAGIRWRAIQDHIDASNLSVKIMQTYSNFTVGGSLSVNVHGRYIGLGPIILSVKKFKIVLADGRIVDASPETHADIFYSAIGGMGGIGVICEVTLALADNVNVARSRELVATENYWAYFSKNVRDNKKVVFHNGDLYPPNFDAVSAVSWSETDKAPTASGRLIPQGHDYWLDRIAWVVMSEWHTGRWIRRHVIDPIIYGSEPPVHTRNYEASYDIAELEPENRKDSTYVLQEYFVPVERFDEWIPKMRKVFADNDVNVINVSIRHSLSDLGAKLAWARKESFAFVVYYKQDTDEDSQSHVGKWTRDMINQVLSVGGTYYLPYQPHATDEQFHRAYPGAIEFFEIKSQYDPTGKFTNKLWDKYYSPEKLAYFKAWKQKLEPTSLVKDYFRPYDNAYLALPEWYIVYAADEYAAVMENGLPSEFGYLQANRDYWEQYDRAIKLTETSPNNNEGYKTVLNVIGWSFATENTIKNIYENTIGRASEFVAGNTQVVEDKYAAKVAKDYAAFIYDYPWYDFPYFSYLKGLWALDSTAGHTFGQALRRIERKLILSVEYGLKTLYSRAIAYATHQEFGVQDDMVSAIVTRDGGLTSELISAPHYQPFTKLLLTEFEKEHNNPDFSIVDIAGNDKITFCYKDKPGSPTVNPGKEILRDTELNRLMDGDKEFVDRITVEAHVKDLVLIYRQLHKKQADIGHFYDY